MTTRMVPQILRDEDMDAEQLDGVKHYRRHGLLPNVFRLMLRYKNLFKAFKPFALHMMVMSSVAPRLREIAILRVMHNNGADYEWHHHVQVAMREDIGMTETEIESIRAGAAAACWSELDAAVISLVDQLKETANVDDNTYRLLNQAMDETAFTELVLTVGNYDMMSKLFNVYQLPMESREDFDRYHSPL